MKKILCLLLAVMMMLSTFVACTKTPASNGNETDASTEAGTPNNDPSSTSKAPYSTFDEMKDSDKTPEPMVKVADIADQYKVGEKNGAITFSPLTCPYFAVSGFPYFKENQNYYRMLQADSAKYPQSVNTHAIHSAGGRIRFRTDSKSMTIYVKITRSPDIAYMTRLASSGIDIYTGTGSNKVLFESIWPTKTMLTYTKTIELSGKETEYTLILPLYTGVSDITISLDPTANVGKPTDYKYEKPVVFYGSSITQGCSAARPGTNYCEVVTRMLDANLVNLGFSGAAKGEQVVADFIAGLDMSAFVLDYDYNASTADDLKATHYNFYKTVRTAHPDLPIIIMTRNNVNISDSDTNAQRRAVIKETYDRAIADGDKNVYFIDGQYVYPEVARELCTVDGTHPTDIGMYYIAQAVYPILKSVLEK